MSLKIYVYKQTKIKKKKKKTLEFFMKDSKLFPLCQDLILHEIYNNNLAYRLRAL